MTLMQLMEFDPRCGNGLVKGFKLHRHYDRQVHTMYILAEEIPQAPSALMREDERRFGERRSCT